MKAGLTRWLEVDGQILRFDPQIGAFVCTLVVTREAVEQQEHVEDLCRQLNVLARLPFGELTELRPPSDRDAFIAWYVARQQLYKAQPPARIDGPDGV